MNEISRQGIDKFIDNAKNIIDTFTGSFLRSGKPTSDRSRAAVMFNNFFLHVQGVKTHMNTLRPSYTLGMGLAAFFLFVIACVSGVLLMIYYNPSIENAYNTVKDLTYVVFAGKLARNIHKWAAVASCPVNIYSRAFLEDPKRRRPYKTGGIPTAGKRCPVVFNAG
jgi:hypothetical protein